MILIQNQRDQPKRSEPGSSGIRIGALLNQARGPTAFAGEEPVAVTGPRGPSFRKSNTPTKKANGLSASVNGLSPTKVRREKLLALREQASTLSQAGQITHSQPTESDSLTRVYNPGAPRIISREFEGIPGIVRQQVSERVPPSHSGKVYGRNQPALKTGGEGDLPRVPGAA